MAAKARQSNLTPISVLSTRLLYDCVIVAGVVGSFRSNVGIFAYIFASISGILDDLDANEQV